MYEYICNDCNYKIEYHLRVRSCNKCNSENLTQLQDENSKNAYLSIDDIEVPVQQKFKKIYYQDQLWYWRREPRNATKHKLKELSKKLRENFKKTKDML